ncbi:MAG: efflux RND transporter periplasmic adaptor subunit [Nitrospirota bacterium]
MSSRKRNNLGKRHTLAIALTLAAVLTAIPVTVVYAQHAGHSAPAADQKQAAPPQATPKAVPAAPAEAPTVEIPLDKQKLLRVKTVAVSFRQIGKVIRTVGRVEYDERKLATVNMKYEGWIEKLHADFTGMQVKKGQPLAEVYSPELLATQQEFLNTLRWAKSTAETKEGAVAGMLNRDAEAIIDAARQRLRYWDITDEQIRIIEETGKTVRTVTLVSPQDGTVIQKNAIQGMRVMPGEKLFDIADLSTVWITADLYEQDMAVIHPGETARISLSVLPGKELSATIEFVNPTLTGDARTVKVRMTVPNPGGRLKPQMFANVDIKVGMGSRLAVPDDAVLDTGTRQLVYVDKGEGNFEPREVKLGGRADGYREVLSGLRSGEKVARSATFLIDSEAQLKGVR